MSSRVCTECGAAADDAAERCESCGALLEGKKLHADSDVRVEHERLDEALPNDPSLPADRWGRVSDHPMPPPLDAPSSSELHTVATAEDSDPSQILTLATHAAAHAQEEEPPRVATGNHAMTPSAELSNLLASDISVTVANGTTSPRLAQTDVRTMHTTGAHPVQARRPPVLASEALQRDLAPPRPARGALRIWSPLLGVIGAAAVWKLTEGRGMGLPLAGAFGGLALLGLPPMPYVGRAAAVTTVAATGLALVLWSGGTAASVPSTLLTLAIGLLASGLYLRAWHRASIVARMTVAAGVLTGATFLRLNGDLANLTVFDTTWQSWLPHLVGLAFGILLMLALLAFMDARSTGGSMVWATALITWHGVYTAVEAFRAAWPKDAATPDFSHLPINVLVAWVSTPPLTALLAIGVAQLMAAGLASVPGPPSDSLRPDTSRLRHDFDAAEARVPPR